MKQIDWSFESPVPWIHCLGFGVFMGLVGFHCMFSSRLNLAFEFGVASGLFSGTTMFISKFRRRGWYRGSNGNTIDATWKTRDQDSVKGTISKIDTTIVFRPFQRNSPDNRAIPIARVIKINQERPGGRFRWARISMHIADGRKIDIRTPDHHRAQQLFC